jgi:hypothetical protein
MVTKTMNILLNKAWILGAIFILLLITLHFLKPEINYHYRLISEYEIGNYGYLMRIAFFCWGSGFLALSIALLKLNNTISGKIASICLLVISIAVIGAGIFITQPITDIIRTNTDRIHAICGALMIFLFPIIAIFITYNLRKIVNSVAAKNSLLFMSILVWIGFLSFFVSMIIFGEQIKSRVLTDDVWIGLPNRFMVLTYTIWLITVSQILLKTEVKLQ